MINYKIKIYKYKNQKAR